MTQQPGAGSSAGTIFGYGRNGIPNPEPDGSDPGIAGYHAVPGSNLPVPTGGGGGSDVGGGGGGKPKFKWQDAYDVEGAPDWWKGLIHKGMGNEAKYGMMYNALLPFMSREDQNYSSSHLSRNFNKEKLWGGYNPANRNPTAGIGSDITTADQRWMEGSERAQGMLSSLQAMAGATGKKFKEFGKGGEWLSTIAQTLKQYGAQGQTNMMTPVERAQMLAALDPILAEGKGQGSKVAPFSEIARMITQPFFSAGPVSPVAKTPYGSLASGQRNPLLF